MATLSPFRALRPKSSEASRIAAVPYDVVSTDEARALADGNPVSFLRVSRAESEPPSDVNPYDARVYDRAGRHFKTPRQTARVLRATAPTDTIAPQARHGRGMNCRIAPTPRRCSPSRFRTIRCRFCRTTGASEILAASRLRSSFTPFANALSSRQGRHHRSG